MENIGSNGLNQAESHLQCSTRPQEFSDSPAKAKNTMTLPSDDSFILLEKLCNDAASEDLIQDVEIPKLDDTLEEVDFILKLGLKLKAEGKTSFPTPKAIPFKLNSVAMNVIAQSSPKSSRSAPQASDPRLSSLISPIKHVGSPKGMCRTNIRNQTNQSPVVSTGHF